MMDSNQARRLLSQSYDATRQLQKQLEKLPILLEEISQNTGVCTDGVWNQVQTCRALDNHARKCILDAKTLLELSEDMRHRELVYGPNPWFDDK